MPLSGKEAGIVTDSNFGDSRPLMDTTKIRLSKTINEHLNKNLIPVVAGFAGADQHDHTTTFGRGGSDYTATIIASCIDADVGHWVAGSGAGYQDACSVGTYQPSTGQSSCIDSSAGYYVDTTASTTQTACAAADYNTTQTQTTNTYE